MTTVYAMGHSSNLQSDGNLEDPKGKPIEKVREIRDEIEQKVKQLIAQQTTAET